MNFQQKIDKIIKKNNSLLCIGLDTEFEKLPKHLLNLSDPIFEFNKAIIDQTSDLVCAYKPNIAFYEAKGIEGLKSLKKTIEYLKKNYPEIPVILDAKRGDIGNTNESYAQAVFDDLGADALTIHPYLGEEASKPFLDRRDKGILILVKTSNPGAGEFQDLKIEGKPLYQIVAEHVVKWNKNGNVGVVVGATYTSELKKVREIVRDMPILIPGVGAQGGDLKETVRAGINKQGNGIIISSSRGIIFAKDPREATLKLTNQIKSIQSDLSS